MAEDRYDVGDALPVEAGFEPGTNILLSGSAGSGKASLGARILGERDDNEGALLITTDGNTSEMLDSYREADTGEAPHFVDCSGARTGPPPDVPPEMFETAGSPADMTGVGVAFEKYSKSLADRTERSRVMYDSLTTLLQYVDEQTAYRFVDVLTGRFTAQGYLSVFTVDPDAVGERASRMLAHEFDAEVRLRVEGGARELSVRGSSDVSSDWVRT